MTTKRDNTTQLGDLFGGGVAAPAHGEVKKQNAKRANFPKDTTIAETNAFHRIRAHWKTTFEHVPGVPRVQNERCNLNAVRKLLRAAQADPDFAYIDESTICQAITLYRRDPKNVQYGCWMRFSRWLSIESIDKYRSQMNAAGHAKLQVAQVKKAATDRASEREKVVKHQLVDVAVWASQRRMTTLAYLSLPPPPALGTTSPGVLQERQAMIDVVERREGLSKRVRDSLTERARTVFTEHYNRVIGSKPADAAIVDGIELALIALYPDSKKLQEATP